MLCVLCQGACELAYAGSEQIEGILYRAASVYWLGVEGDVKRLSFQQSAAARFLQTRQKEGLHRGMQDEVGTKELKGAFGAEGRSGFFTQDGGPAQVVGGAVDGFLIGHARFVLEQSGEREQGRGYAGSALLVFIESAEVLILEEPRCSKRELGMEACGIEGECEDVADLEQGHLCGAFTEHEPTLLRSADVG